jgi:hypothetical protein
MTKRMCEICHKDEYGFICLKCLKEREALDRTDLIKAVTRLAPTSMLAGYDHISRKEVLELLKGGKG